MLDIAKATKLVDQCWSDEIVQTLVEFIKIPNKSPAFDPDWAAHGYMDQAVALFERWARAKPAFPGASLEVVRLPRRTPVIVIEIPGEGEGTVLPYGHLDKQLEMMGWAQGYGPWIRLLRPSCATWSGCISTRQPIASCCRSTRVANSGARPHPARPADEEGSGR